MALFEESFLNPTGKYCWKNIKKQEGCYSLTNDGTKYDEAEHIKTEETQKI